MREHAIRLRGGWEWHDLAAQPARSKRVTLPLAWPADPAGTIRLVRRFGCPPIDTTRESLVLRLENVPGLVSVHFNERNVALGSATVASLRLEPIRPNNVLVLEVDPARAARDADPPGAWGQVALVIRPA